MNVQIPWSETIVATALYIILNLLLLACEFLLEIFKKCLTSHRSIRRSVDPSFMIVSPAKTADPIPVRTGNFEGKRGGSL